MDIIIPADVPPSLYDQYHANFAAATHNTARLMLFACDQKIEHLNKDFYGNTIHPDAQHPQHLFKIAEYGRIGAMAAPLGLIARYGKLAPNAQYIAKLNGKTNLLSQKQTDPLSAWLWHVDDVLQFKKSSGLNICGVGMTLYIGSIYETQMLSHAAQMILQAHRHGLLTLIWIYPRGAAIHNEQDPELAAGAAGLANALGADFVKIKPPANSHPIEALKRATTAAGNTGVICSGGELQEPEIVFRRIYDEIHNAHARGAATGRNIFQRSLPEAIAMTHAISAIIYDDATPGAAYDIYIKSIK